MVYEVYDELDSPELEYPPTKMNIGSVSQQSGSVSSYCSTTSDGKPASVRSSCSVYHCVVTSVCYSSVSSYCSTTSDGKPASVRSSSVYHCVVTSVCYSSVSSYCSTTSDGKPASVRSCSVYVLSHVKTNNKSRIPISR